MRFVSDADVRRVLTFPTLIAAFETAHRRPRAEICDGFLGDEAAQYVARNAAEPGRYFLTKLFTSVPRNLAAGRLPAVQAVCVMFDGRDGRALAVFDGTEITRWRTAADSALAARYLARPEPVTLLVVGAGAMARYLIEAHRTVRPSLRRLVIWNRTRARADALAQTLPTDLTVDVTDDLDAATSVADVITCCTRSRAPLIRGANLRAGTHLDLVGGYTPATREADDDAARRSRIFVDRRESAFHGVGDIVAPIASGAIAESAILGDLYDLATGAMAGRQSADDITFFKNAGGGHLDLMACETVLGALGQDDA